MKKTGWHFYKRQPRDIVSDSANDAFFTADKLDNLSEALVREGIQNSLDAASDKDGRQVTVRIKLVKKPNDSAKKWIKDVYENSIEHFTHGVELKEHVKFPLSTYLVFEDFGTTGLTGDIEASQLSEGGSNAFWGFFRAVGISGKKEDSLGRWGIGKQVFALSSLAGSMIGLTIRQDTPNRVLMGAATLRSRTIGGMDFHGNARYGFAEENGNDIIMPVDESHLIDAFSQAFELKRKDECGLSIVVPWVDERINIQDIQKGVIKNFFWPIFREELTVLIAEDDDNIIVDFDHIKNLGNVLEDEADQKLLEFAAWASFADKPDEYIELAIPTRPSWNSAGDLLYTDEVLKNIKNRLENNGRVCLKVPLIVRRKEEDAKETDGSFLIFYEPCKSKPHPTVFLREGIVITDVPGSQTGSSRSLVVVEKGALASLLGDSEGVNHTQWQKDSPKFHNKYAYGKETINFVTRSVGEMLRRLNPTQTEKKPDLLLHFFSVSDDDSKEKEQKSKPDSPAKTGNTTEGGGKGPPSASKRYKLDRREDGFVILPNKSSDAGVFPYCLQVKAGFAVRRGNGINSWAPDDFRFGYAPLRYEPAKPKGASIKREDGNVLIIEIKSPDFEIGVFGFGKTRDLEIRIVEEKNETNI